jgi:hypothetical protein
MNEQPTSENGQLVTGIIAALCEFYRPTGTVENMELKTTTDLADEMAAIADIGKNEISNAMQAAGFNLKYTAAGVFWILYPVN